MLIFARFMTCQKPFRSGLPPGPRGATYSVRAKAETTLAGIWQELLGAERVGIHDEFFALGGDSIVSIQLVNRARGQGLSISVRDVFTHKSLEALARVAEAMGDALVPNTRCWKLGDTDPLWTKEGSVTFGPKRQLVCVPRLGEDGFCIGTG